MPSVKRFTLTPEDEIRLWLFRNRGVLARIAREADVGRTWVSTILYGKTGETSKDYRIERALAEVGAPYMQERLRDLLEKSA